MTPHSDMTTAQWALFSACLIALSAVAFPGLAEEKPDSKTGCTLTQSDSAAGRTCEKKGEKDLSQNAPKVHTLVCKSGEILCCLTEVTSWHPYGGGTFSDCEVLGAITPPPEVVCSSLKSAKGVWAPDPKTIKANSDKKTCSQVYNCNPPKELSESQSKCTAFVSVSNKQVTMTGRCVPGSSPGMCSSCLGNPPNDPCMVSFRK